MSEQQEINTPSSIDAVISSMVRRYLETLGNENNANLYQTVLEQAEESLFDVIMPHFHGNQVRAANALGLSRGTLRKKLKQYFGDKYCGERAI